MQREYNICLLLHAITCLTVFTMAFGITIQSVRCQSVNVTRYSERKVFYNFGTVTMLRVTH